jgi:hypothetical protein
MSVILVTQEGEIRCITVGSQPMQTVPAPANSSARSYLKKPFTKRGLVEWLEVKALSSSPNTANK